MLIRFHFTFILALFAAPCIADDLPGIPLFIDEMVTKHQFKREELVQVFQRAHYQQTVITAITTPSTIKPWLEYRAAFINDKRIKGGLEFWSRYAAALKIAEKEYGVPQEIIVAVIGVETLYGRNSGKFSVLDALTTLAFSYPPRAAFFRSELENYLLLARDQEWELFKIQSSYAGALGIPQFMPSSYRKHAVDFDNDDEIDLLNDPIDAIGSVANYLKQYGWRKDEPVAVRAKVSAESCPGSLRDPRPLVAWKAAGVIPLAPYNSEYSALLLDFTVATGAEFWLAFKNFQVITLYNNSNFYAMSVFQLANALRNER
ncbi:MAG: lytic murein transglycosylase B [Gallionellaceae bacterium]|nr:lytic murein transglycosylase B [Gallionellaceae bacterium]